MNVYRYLQCTCDYVRRGENGVVLLGHETDNL